MEKYNETNASVELGNTGLQNYPGSPGKWKHFIAVPKGTEIATKVLALTKSTWTNGINAAMANRWFVLPLIFNGEPTQEDPKREDSDFGYSSFVDNGKLTYKATFKEMHPYNKNEIFKLNNSEFDFYIATDENKILGCTYDNVKFLPFKVDYSRVLPETQRTGSAVEHVQFEIKFSNIDEMNLRQVVLDPSVDTLAPAAWYPAIELPAAAIKDLILSIVSMTSTSLIFDLKGYDGVAYTAAVAEDLYFRKTTIDGSAITISTLTQSATIPGRYTAAFSSQTSGTFYASLYDQPTATTEGVETPENDSIVFSES